MADSKTSTKKALRFSDCGHFRMDGDNHRKCQTCRVADGRTRCSRYAPCSYCAPWSDDLWRRAEKASTSAAARKQKKREKKEKKAVQTSMSVDDHDDDDSVDLHPADESFETAGGPVLMKSVVAKLPSRQVSPEPWNFNFRRSVSKSPAPKRRRSSDRAVSSADERSGSYGALPVTPPSGKRLSFTTQPSARSSPTGPESMGSLALPSASADGVTTRPASHSAPAGSGFGRGEVGAAPSGASDASVPRADLAPSTAAVIGSKDEHVSRVSSERRTGAGDGAYDSVPSGSLPRGGPVHGRPVTGMVVGGSRPSAAVLLSGSSPAESVQAEKGRQGSGGLLSTIPAGSVLPVSSWSFDLGAGPSTRRDPPSITRLGLPPVVGSAPPVLQQGSSFVTTDGGVDGTSLGARTVLPSLGFPLDGSVPCQPAAQQPSGLTPQFYVVGDSVPAFVSQPTAGWFSTDQVSQMLSMVRSCLGQQSQAPQVNLPSDSTSRPAEPRPSTSSGVELTPQLPVDVVMSDSVSSVDPILGPSLQRSVSVAGSSSAEGREDDVVNRVSERQYALFREAVRSSKGVHTVVEREDSTGTSFRFDGSESAAPDRVVWGTQPAVRDALKLLAKKAQGVESSREVIDTPLTDLAAPGSKFKFFSARSLLGPESYMLKTDSSSEYLLKPPSQTPTDLAPPSSYNVSPSALLQTEELSRRAAVYGSITDVLVSSILRQIPEEARTPVLREQVQIMGQASRRCVTAAAAAAANLQLVRRDAVLHSHNLKEEYCSRARVAPFTGANVIGPNPREFNETLMTLKTEQNLHQGLTTHFKIPLKTAPKTLQRKSVHQRLGPSSSDTRQPFRAREQRSSTSTAAPPSRKSGTGYKRGQRGAGGSSKPAAAHPKQQ